MLLFLERLWVPTRVQHSSDSGEKAEKGFFCQVICQGIQLGKLG